SVFLFSSVSKNQDNNIQAINKLDEKSMKELQIALGSNVITTTPVEEGGGKTFTVYYRPQRNTSGDDFAKQLLVMIGTLVTSVASFYFGTRASASAAEGTTKPAPEIRSISPTTQALGSSFTLEVVGNNLDDVTDLMVVQGTNHVSGTNIS